MDAFNEVKDVFDEISFDKIKSDFYNMATSDFNNGASLEQMQEVLDGYEEMEWYAACAGIHKAINEQINIRKYENKIIK